jgi:alkylhydroperoxidase family enzyme
MARLPYVDPTAAPPRVRDALEAMPPLNLFGMLAHAETAFIPLMRFGGALLGAAELDARLRELAILRVSQLTPGAEYEWTQHVPVAMAVGAGQDEIDALAAGELDAACLGDDGRLVLRFTEEVVRDASPSEATWNEASARFSPREILELLLTIGHYMMLGRVMATTRLDPDPAMGNAVLERAQRTSRSS